jgi:ribosome maturation factor RimP
MSHDVAAKVHALVEPAVEAAGYELVEAQWKHEPGGWVIRLLIDNPAGSVGLGDCERVSREVSVLLDVHDVVPHAYSLEVSSPGLDRPLLKPSHFRRFLGKRAKVRLRGGVAGRRNFTGTIVNADESRIFLEVDGKEQELPMSDLERGQLVFEMDHKLERTSKEGK